MGKYCSYCHDYGHDIEGCFDVTHVVQQLIDDGKISIPKGWIPPILSFTNADLPRVINFSQPLCVTLGCNYRRISGILVDNKSNFNICSKESLCKLRQKSVPLGISNAIIITHDHLPRKAIGTINMQLRHEDWLCDVEFQVVEAPINFPLILGKPWLHDTQAIASALHQKVKFSTPKGVMVIHGDIPTTRIPPVYCNVVRSIENPTLQHNQLKSRNRGNAMSLWELISDSPTHRDALIRQLKTITIDLFEESTNTKAFMSKDILCNREYTLSVIELDFAILKAKTSKDEKDCPKVSAIGNSGMGRNHFDLHRPYSDQLVDSFDTILPEHESYAGVLCQGNRLSESSMILQLETNHQEWTFTKADLPPNPWHTRELHITLRHGRTYINHILVDNGSALDICSREFLYRLGYTDSFINPLSYTILGFDDTPREVTGYIILPLSYETMVFYVRFMVINCPTSYNLLLGRPWLHEYKGVASTLHQKVKLVTPLGVITIPGDFTNEAYS
uniref:Uncharacterized protein n=1 Tax=Chenopodium quinoa TaxID=63459 RepID=A0A803MX27_CHEQI